MGSPRRDTSTEKYKFLTTTCGGSFYYICIDLSFATSQPEFLPTQIGKLWKAISANQEKIAIFGNNVTKFVDFV